MPTDLSLSPAPVLLGLLMAGPRHGYELHQAFSAELGRVWRVGRSQLYGQLKQMAAAGLVAVETEAQPSRPARKVYRLTAAGREAFLAWLRRPAVHLRHIRLELLARLYFFRRLGLPGQETLIDEQQALLRGGVRALAGAAAAEDDYQRLVLAFRQGQVEAVIRWLDRCREASWSGSSA